MYYPQGPVAIGSFVFADADEGRLARILESLPYPRPDTRVRIELAVEQPDVLAAVHEAFGSDRSTARRIDAYHNDIIVIAYGTSVSDEFPSSMISVSTLGRFTEMPVVTVAWGSERPDRDICCDDVFAHYSRLAAESECLCSVLAIEQQVLKLDARILFPVADVCAVTFGEKCVRSEETGFESVVEAIRRSVGAIGGWPCVVK